MYEDGIVCESVEIGSTGRPLAFDAYGKQVEVTLNDEGYAVAFDDDRNQIEIRECEGPQASFTPLLLTAMTQLSAKPSAIL
jgi:hypothetical protein